MFTSLGTFLQTAVDSAQQSLFLPVFIIAALIAAAVWMLGRHGEGKSLAMATLIGGSIWMLAKTLGTAFQQIPH
jgi:hypothetical protein